MCVCVSPLGVQTVQPIDFKLGIDHFHGIFINLVTSNVIHALFMSFKCACAFHLWTHLLFITRTRLWGRLDRNRVYGGALIIHIFMWRSFHLIIKWSMKVEGHLRSVLSLFSIFWMTSLRREWRHSAILTPFLALTDRKIVRFPWKWAHTQNNTRGITWAYRKKCEWRH